LIINRRRRYIFEHYGFTPVSTHTVRTISWVFVLQESTYIVWAERYRCSGYGTRWTQDQSHRHRDNQQPSQRNQPTQIREGGHERSAQLNEKQGITDLDIFRKKEPSISIGKVFH